MASPRVFTIEPNPHWVIIDNFSKLPVGAAIYTYRSLNPTEFKAAFQDAGGTVPYGQPIIGFGNGTMPPIFWEFDPLNPQETYYIRVYDKENVPGSDAQFLWDFDGLSGGGSGGGGTVITATNLENLIVNNILFRNIGNQAGTPSLPLFLTIAPSNNAGFVGNAASLSDGQAAPDITFQKKNNSASDSLSFIPFTPLGTNALNADVTPDIYFEYACTVPGAAETFKYVQFPINKGMSLSQQIVTIKIYARCNSGNTQLTLKWRQFYGDGGGSAETLIDAGAVINLTANWTGYLIPSTIPDATTKTVGACGNDGLFLQVSFPFDAATTIDFIKPAVYLGNVAPGIDFVSNDEVDSIVNSPRTGDVRFTLNSFMPGWLPMDNGTIGSLASASGLSTRANIDTFPLFDLIWNLFVSNQALAPMFAAGSVGPIIAYGASSIADFTANRQLGLTKVAGRVIAAVSLTVPIGTFTGTDTHTLTVNELASHHHNVTPIGNADVGGGSGHLQMNANNDNQTSSTFTTADTGNNQPFSLYQPTAFMNVMIKL